MEDALAVYERPPDPTRPVVCLDETGRQLLGGVRPPAPPAPGRPARQDPEHARGGVANPFLVTEPPRGRRAARVGERRTRLDCAHCARESVDARSPGAERIVPAMDRLDTHPPAPPYAAFAPAEAKRLAEQLEIRDTPRHGSRPSMAETDLSVLGRQCPARRPAGRDATERAVGARAARRNADAAAVRWQVTAADARTKLRRLYPAFDD
jgi:DDE superfamily endonuclease